ncbi:hypothetical protein U1Q18_013731 [Sarracenia purpurea var. burkii]
MGTTEGIDGILRRFGDEQSTLLDQFERLSIEIQLHQAILGRSLSESVVRTQPPLLFLPPPPTAVVSQQVRQGRRRGSGFKNALKRLLKTIVGRNGGRKEVLDPKDPRPWKPLSRSMRV